MSLTYARAAMSRLQLLPLACLLSVAANQLRLVSTEHLSPWSGGGFGMFSTLDAGSNRHLHVIVSTPDIRSEVVVPAEFEDDVLRVLTLPSETRLKNLAVQLTTPGRVSSSSRIEIQVWANRYDSLDLSPSGRLITSYSSDVVTLR